MGGNRSSEVIWHKKITSMVNDRRSLVKDKRNLVNDKKSNEGIKRPITKEGDVQTLAFRQRVFLFTANIFFSASHHV